MRVFCLFCQFLRPSWVGKYGYCAKLHIYKWTPYHNCLWFQKPTFDSFIPDLINWYNRMIENMTASKEALVQFCHENNIDTTTGYQKDEQ